MKSADSVADRLGAMRAFIAVVENGGFSAAARRLGVSPSAVTRAIDGLERALGTQLLQRTTRAVRLTRPGQAFLPLARSSLDHFHAAEQAAKNEAGLFRGKIRVAAPIVLGRTHVAQLLADFMSLYPEVSVELLLANDFAALIDDEVDVAIRIGRLQDSGLRARSLGQTRPCIAASPGYLDQHGVPNHPQDLASHRLIGFEGVVSRRAWTFCVDGMPTTVAVDPAFYSDSAEAAIVVAARGGGIVFALRYQIAKFLRTGELVEVLADFAPPAVPIQAVLPGSRFVSTTVRALLDHLARAHPTWSD